MLILFHFYLRSSWTDERFLYLATVKGELFFTNWLEKEEFWTSSTFNLLFYTSISRKDKFPLYMNDKWISLGIGAGTGKGEGKGCNSISVPPQ